MGVLRSRLYSVPCFHTGNSPTLPQLPVPLLCIVSGIRFVPPEGWPGHSRVADFQSDSIVTFTVPIVLFTSVLMTSAFALAAPVSQFDAAQELARKDYEAAMARIASVSKADQLECARQAGPAAKACTIQADGKRDAAEEEAKSMLAHAREQPPASKKDQEAAAAAGKTSWRPAGAPGR